jgi:hypothetical protein
MTLRIQCLNVDCRAPDVVAGFWEVALGWRRTHETADQIVLEPPAGSPEDGGLITWTVEQFLRRLGCGIPLPRLRVELRRHLRDARARTVSAG